MFTHGKNTVFKIDTAGGVLTDISQYLTSVDYPDNVESHETTTFGKTRKTRIAGLGDGSVAIQGNWDPALDAILAPIKGLIGTYEYGPDGSAAGKIKYGGEVLCTSYQVQSPVGGQVTFSASFEMTDTQTRGVYP